MKEDKRHIYRPTGMERDAKGKFVTGPKPKIWTEEQYRIFEKLCEKQLTIEEICDTMDVGEKKIQELCKARYKDEEGNGLTVGKVREKFQNRGRGQIREMQWKACERGNVQMLMWFGKNYLGQKENPETNKGIEEIKNNIQDLTDILKAPKDNRDIT